MVFFPGGRYEQGGAGVPLYDGAYLAQHGNMVVVTTNYRLGVLGFLVVDGLEGNFGMIALWVAYHRYSCSFACPAGVHRSA